MTTYYVATLGAYVLVDAENEVEARELGQPALEERYAEVRKGRPDAPVVIRTVRPASDDEIQLWQWHQEAMSGEEAKA
jgi:hypothetical protein